MNKRFFWLGIVFGAMFFTAAVSYVLIKSNNSPDIDLNKVAVVDFQGNSINVAELNDKPMVVNYWATWCGPCVAEFPHFEEAKQTVGEEINFVMISDESIEKIQSFVDKNEYSFTFLKSNKALSAYGINAIPQSYFYNRDGELVEKTTGGLSLLSIKTNIDKIR